MWLTVSPEPVPSSKSHDQSTRGLPLVVLVLVKKTVSPATGIEGVWTKSATMEGGVKEVVRAGPNGLAMPWVLVTTR